MSKSKAAGAHIIGSTLPFSTEDKIPFKQVYLDYQFCCLIFTERLYELGYAFSQS